MQSEGTNTVCRLCFKSCEHSFEDVEVVTSEMLRILRLELDLDVRGKPVICKICSENVQKCFDFKTICLRTEDYINSFRDDRNNIKLDLKDIYLRKHENKKIAVSKCRSICRLCMEMAESGCSIPLNDETEGVTSAKTILRRYFSELDLDITKNPDVCTPCIESLNSYFTFIKNCLDVKDGIEMCCKMEGGENKSEVEANRGLQLGAKNVSHNKDGCSGIDTHKNCNENELYHETKLKVENIEPEESRDWQIKHEVNEYEEIDYVKVENLGDLVGKCPEDEQNGDTELNYENFVGVEDPGFDIKHEEINIKTDGVNTDGCQNNVSQYCLNAHVLIHENTFETTLYLCGICSYKTKRKGDLQRHMLIHKSASEVTMYSCEICTYKAKEKGNLKRHMMIHKNASEVTVHSCEMCSYKAKDKGRLKQHILIHKDASEVTMYSCEICTYKSRYKSCLKQHVLIHKNDSEVKMYSCEQCTYKAKHKSNLKQHSLIHKDASEVAVCSCEICTYKTRRKSDLQRHMLIHKSALEVTMYSCEICTYKTKHKPHLKKHMLIHKNASEVAMYSCELCTYKGKHISSLKRHMLVHKNESEVTTYSCELCTYKSKRKGNLKQHMLIHKNDSEVIMYFCELCTYTGKHKGSFKQHMLTHKDASEVAMYSCEICTYKTKHKRKLEKQHMLIHKNTLEVTMYSCEMCTYKTKYKSNLKQHKLIHGK